jgi:hypothetical protein
MTPVFINKGLVSSRLPRLAIVNKKLNPGLAFEYNNSLFLPHSFLNVRNRRKA